VKLVYQRKFPAPILFRLRGLIMIRVALLCALALLSVSSFATPPVETESVRPKLHLSRVGVAPTLEDFLEMRPSDRLKDKMASVADFVQRDPRDGEPAAFKTVVYAGYDQKNLYAVFVCFDPDPAKIRTGVSRREDVTYDDRVLVTIDTFADQRRAYRFVANPNGIQWDGTFTEGVGEDAAWDAVWHARGAVTKEGYVVWMAIPFKSLRFPPEELQNWGVIFTRVIPRLVEYDYWPAVSRRTSGTLNKAAQMDGLERISPGRNMQFIPYGVFRSSRSTDLRDPANYHFRSERAKFDGGLDSKFVLKDSLVLDATINPDFSQVEADAPQVMINNRFEVYLPEKRPFFLENTNFFQTPLDLLFTRRIADPSYGVRLTGRLGKFTVGGLFADDQEPGKIVPENDPLSGKRAYFSVLRATRELGNQSSFGVIYTDREFEGAYNRVGGADVRWKLHPRWVTNIQAVTSSTRFNDGSTTAGPAYMGDLSYSSRDLEMQTRANYVSPGFFTETGYMPQTDVARVEHFVGYEKKSKKGGALVGYGPSVQVTSAWDHDGLNIERILYTRWSFNFVKESRVELIWDKFFERLRPVDFASLDANRDYGHHSAGFHADLGIWRKFQLCTNWRWETRINYVGATRFGPDLANANYTRTVGIFRPSKRMTVRNEYIWLRLRERNNNASVFNNHIFRTRWNWQFNKELSFRVIGDYNTVLANPLHTRLQSDKKLNLDFLITYLIQPGTAVYVGYNSNLRNYDPALRTDDHGRLLRTRDKLINDGRQLFVKVSYLYQF